MSNYVTMLLFMVLAWIISSVLAISLGFFLLKLRKERTLRLHLQEKLTGLEVGMRTLQDTRSQFERASYHQSLDQKEMRISKAMITLEHSLTLSTELAVKGLGAHTCALFLVEPPWDPPVLSLKTIAGSSPHLVKSLRVTSADGLLGLILKEQKPISYPNVTENVSAALPYYSKPVVIKGFFAVPIFGDHGLEGLFLIDRLKEGPLSPDEQQIFNLLGRQIAGIISETRLQGRTEDHAQELFSLYEASKALSAPLSVVATVETIMRVTRQTIRCDSLLLALLHEQRLIIEGAIGYDPKRFPPGGEIPQKGLFEWIIGQAKPVLFQGRPGQAGLPSYLEEGLKVPAQSFLIVPLTMEGSVTGLLKCDSGQPEFFTEYDREILGILANQAALALERAKRFEEERQRATTDALTGLANHRHFQDHVARLFEHVKSQPTPITLILCDIDHFKNINDTYGHLQGDTALKQLGLLLLKSCRDDTMIARYGGEEFAILLSGADRDTGLKIAERIRERVGRELQVSVNGNSTTVTVSLGVASFPRDAQDSRGLFHAADQALYQAKADGRNQVRSSTEVRGKG